jgi:hypothetical protein
VAALLVICVQNGPLSVMVPEGQDCVAVAIHCQSTSHIGTAMVSVPGGRVRCPIASALSYSLNTAVHCGSAAHVFCSAGTSGPVPALESKPCKKGLQATLLFGRRRPRTTFTKRRLSLIFLALLGLRSTT